MFPVNIHETHQKWDRGVWIGVWSRQPKVATLQTQRSAVSCFVFWILGITVKTVKHLFTDSLCCTKKKRKKKRRGEVGERSGYSPKHEPAKQRYTVQSMECSLCAKVIHKLFFHSVQGCHNLLLRDSNRRRKLARKNNNRRRATIFICMLYLLSIDIHRNRTFLWFALWKLARDAF